MMKTLSRVASVLLLGLLVLGLAPERANAQLKCANISQSPGELMRILNFRGRPGDTVLMPFYFENDSLTVGFRFLIKFDTSKLTILADTNNSGFPDPIFKRVIPAGRLASVLNLSQFFASSFEGKADVASVFMGPQLDNTGDTIPADTGVAFYLPFVVKSTLGHLTDTARFTLPRTDIIGAIDSSGFPPDTLFVGCNQGEMSQVWFDGVTSFDFAIFPRNFTGTMNFISDTTPPKPTIIFTGSPLTVTTGGLSTLSWSVTNADSLFIRQNGVRLGLPTFSLAGSTIVAPPTNPTVYRLLAFKGSSVDSATVSITVTGGGGGGGGTPTISFTPSTNVYSVNPGQTVSFTVNASSTIAGNISLSPGSLPTNATFGPTNPVIGPTPVSGTFSFTPNTSQQNQTFVISFSGSNTAGTGSNTVTINVTSLPVDRLFTTSAPGQAPVGGLRGTPGIKFPINMVSTKTVYGIQFDMGFPHNQMTLDSFTVTDRIPDYVINEFALSPGKVRVVAFGLNNEPVVDGSSTAVLNGWFSIDSSAICTDDYVITIDSGFESFDPDPNMPADTFKTDDGVIQVDCPGDVNLDRDVNVADVVNIVGSIIDSVNLNTRQFAAADIVINNNVDVFDLVADIDLIFNGNIVPAPPQPSTALPSTVALAHADLVSGDQGTLFISSDLSTEVAGVQLELSYDPRTVLLGKPQLNVDQAIRRNFSLLYRDNGAGKIRLMLYTTKIYSTHEQLQQGFANLIKIPITAKGNLKADDRSKIRLSDAMLSTGEALAVTVTGIEPPLPTSFALKQNYPNPFNPTTIIEFAVGSEGGSAEREAVVLEIYNVLGQQVKTLVNEELPPGNYRYEWNATDDIGARVATGVYLYRLSVGETRESKKMLFLK
jgi:hypothetical protein